MRPVISPGRGGRRCLAAAAIFTVIAAAAMAALTGCGGEADTGPYAGLFPEPAEVEQVTGAGQVAEYRDESLYDFLNGGAELYFDYDIVAAASREYMLPEDSGVEVSIYDMGEPRDAFGIYSIFRYAGADRAEIGNEAIQTQATLDFWKGRYYCKLFAFGPAEEAETVMASLARTVAGRISDGGSEPDLLGVFPGDGLIAGSGKYFRRHLALNNIRYVDSDNVLGLGDATEGVTAEYSAGEIEYTAYVIRYPAPGGAEAAFDGYSDFLAARAETTSLNGIRVFIFEGGRTEAIALTGRYIVGTWDAGAAGPGLIERLLAALGGEG